MKIKLSYLLILVLPFLFSLNIHNNKNKYDKIVEDTIYVDDLNMTYLIFEDSEVEWVNIGNQKDFKIDLQNNIILVKSLNNNSSSTNFMFGLSDNNMLTGLLKHDRTKKEYFKKYKFNNIKEIKPSYRCIESVDYNKEDYKSLGVIQDDILLQIVNVYKDGQNIYIRLKMSNDSNIDYDIDFIKIYIKDSKTKILKQEIVDIDYNKSLMLIGGVNYIHICCKLIHISEKDIISIELIEKNGFRNIKIELDSKTLSNAKNK